MKYLIDKYIGNDDIKNPEVRQKYATLASIIGITFNTLLFVFKFLIGLFTNSISIISDAFNNLSDCVNSIIMLVGYKLSNKMADEEHPFGHGRYEYIVSLVLAMMILLVAYELIKNSILRLFDANSVKFSFIAIIILIVSISVKLYLSIFYKKLSIKSNSSNFNVLSKDSFNDVIATSIALASMILSLYTSLPIDAILGIFVSLFILKSAYEIIVETTNILLGKKVDEEIIEEIKSIIKNHENIIGFHDLMLHSYGVFKIYGSCHVEIDSKTQFSEVHRIIDKIEKTIFKKTGVLITLHCDPINVDDENRNKYMKEIIEIVKEINNDNEIHDFRVLYLNNETIIKFDLVVPYNFKFDYDEINKILNYKMNKKYKNIKVKTIIENKFS